MTMRTLCVGALGTNCYLVADEHGAAVMIDPGGEPERIAKALADEGWTLRAVLLTHVHFDHIGALEELTVGRDIPVYCHEDEVEALSDGTRNLSAMFGRTMCPCVQATPVREGDTINVGSLTFEVWHTPGHTPGSVCYATDEAIFSGDTLFCESIGRTDFPGGSPAAMARSLRRLLSLEDARRVYPGHDEPTTLMHERQYNPYAGL